ncbi:molybdopterin-dependent oxidoreductase [Flexistipes sp.]|uniref:molybdopterin-dependent oxidoreductase n=1 Tax=Flexistipes sp. TaxID=3088135 RepID=UPI002E1CE7C4|nr:molybdopterin-dependent oxidoreductase [Flexistipes sp.]
MKIRRREFLKASAAVATVTALGCGTKLNALEKTDKTVSPYGKNKGEWIPTTCQGCTTWDPIQVYVQNGRAVKVRGNEYSKMNGGYCCARGHLGLQQVYDPDRVKVPMKRTNPKKGRFEDPKFVPISWDEALNTIADNMMKLRDNGEAHKYVCFRGRYTYTRDIIYSSMTKIFGSSNNISHSAICAEADKSGPFFTEGLWDYRDYDLTNTKYLVCWGADPLRSNRQVPTAINKIGEVMDRATVVAVDPTLTTIGAKANEWMPVKPGEDGALAVAIAHVILREGLWYKEFVGDFKDGKNRFKLGEEVDESTFKGNYTHGLVKWWNIELKDKTPEWAERITGVKADQIYRVARGMGAAAPKVAVWLGPGAAMHIRGTYSSMAIHALNGLMGSTDNIGGPMAKISPPYNHTPSIKKYQDTISKNKPHVKIDQRGYLKFPALKKGKSGGGVVTNNAADGILQEDPMEIKMVLGYMNNFNFSGTEGQRWDKALAKVPFTVHLSTHASEFSMFADIVLPAATTTFEKWAWLKTKANRIGTGTLLQPVVKPIWEAKIDESEIPYMIAEKLAERGFDNLLEYYKNEFKDPDTGKKPTNEREFAEYATKYYLAPMWQGHDKGGDSFKSWEEFRKIGVWNSDPYPYRKRWGKFKTKTHQFEFYSETLKEALAKHAKKHNVDVNKVLEVTNYTARDEKAFVPHYEEPYRYGSKSAYPFTFIDSRSKLNKEGRSANCPWMQEFRVIDVGDERWDNVLKMNPDDAKRLGLKNGDMVKITTVVTSRKIKVKLSEGVRPGTVLSTYGQGHTAYGRIASKKFGKEGFGMNNNDLMPADYDRLSGSTARNGGFVGVRIEKV